MLTELDRATYGNEEADKELENLRGLLLWALYNHQGGNSTIGQPIRKALGIGKFDGLTSEQIEKAQIAAGIIDGSPYRNEPTVRYALDHSFKNIS